MSINIKVNDIASRKISLHSLKYLTEDVFGKVFLLGIFIEIQGLLLEL